ncbi:hypothetical protein HW555_010777 [Spodoptera exigua]|uniref:Uncharacterized protein n=1 Tax=Spodoptera exigua TaxID=7107 RepID=A0A835GAK9_SPOEX|nr:hypothetical protein HW555_010777 [Spodoptera exigua]
MADQEDLEQTQDPGMSISKMIGEKLTESIQNLDVFSTLQKMVSMEPGDEESEGIQNKLKGVLEKFRDMSPEEKKQFAAQIKEGLASKLSMRLKDNAMLAGVEDAIRSAVVTKLYMVAAAVLVFILVLDFLLGPWGTPFGPHTVVPFGPWGTPYDRELEVNSNFATEPWDTDFKLKCIVRDPHGPVDKCTLLGF